MPSGWNPATATAPTKAPASAAVATVTEGSELAAGTKVSSSLATAAVATSASLVKNQRSQTTSYYCGPAAVHEALGVQGVSSSQNGLADRMNTTSDGTAWYTGSSYPVPDTLNTKLGHYFYVPVNVNYTPTSAQTTAYKTDLVSDISNGYAPIGNAYEVPGGPHLVGHPTNKTIYHYFEIRGYSSAGSSTMYEDSVHGASSISWSSGVPAYSTMSSATITTIVGGRGYVW